MNLVFNKKIYIYDNSDLSTVENEKFEYCISFFLLLINQNLLVFFNLLIEFLNIMESFYFYSLPLIAV